MFFKKALLAIAGLAAAASANALVATPEILEERALVCPAGSATGITVVISVSVIVVPVVVNQYYESNTIINIGGITISIINAPTTLITTVLATSTQTVTSTVTATASAAPTPFFLTVQQIGVAKRQNAVNYIGLGGKISNDCILASAFTLSNGELSANGLIVSTGQSYPAPQAFAASANTGAISTTFAFSGNFLQWNNPFFHGGAVSFCISTTGVKIVFDGLLPNGCIPAVITQTPAQACAGLPSASISPSASVTPSSNISITYSASISASVTPSSNISITATTTTAPSATSSPFNLVIDEPSAVKRQAGSRYIGRNGAATSDRTQAAVYNIVGTTLYVDGVLFYYSATNFTSFTPSGTSGLTSFFFAGEILVFSNPAFAGALNRAFFCILADIIQVVSGQAPSNCPIVNLAPAPVNAPSTSITSSFSNSTSAGLPSTSGVSSASLVSSTVSASNSSVSVTSASSAITTPGASSTLPVSLTTSASNFTVTSASSAITTPGASNTLPVSLTTSAADSTVDSVTSASSETTTAGASSTLPVSLTTSAADSTDASATTSSGSTTAIVDPTSASTSASSSDTITVSPSSSSSTAFTNSTITRSTISSFTFFPNTTITTSTTARV